MIQLYALIKQPAPKPLDERFPDAVEVGDKKLGVFASYERDIIESLGDVEILTYEQAKELVDLEIKDEFDI